MHRLVLGALLFGQALVAPAVAQTIPYPTAYVLCATTVTPAAFTLEVDLATGAFTALPGHPSDLLSPLAIERDPIDDTFLVALAAGPDTRVMRRRWRPAVSESLVGTVPGHSVELLVDRFGDVVVVTGGAAGGVHRLPRRGGIPTLVRALPRLSAAGAPQTLHWNAILAQSGQAAPAADPVLSDIDLESGAYGWGPGTLVGYTPRGIVGLLDLPTAVPRQILAHDDGTLALYSFFLGGSQGQISLAPTLPNGGIVAMKSHEAQVGILLGGNANPFLYAFDPLTAITGSVALTTLAGPLPGTPVDYTVADATGPGVLRFGRPCGVAAELRIGTTPGAGPAVGNAAFGVTLHQASPQLPAWIVLGFGETAFPMPNGCRLQVTLDAIGARTTDPNGDATQPVPIPNDPGLVGVRIFGQWLQVDGAVPFMTSDLLRIVIG